MTDWTPIESHPSLAVSRAGGAAKIEFNRPEVLNALDAETSKALLELLEMLSHDDQVRAVLMTGRGRAFSAGADIASEFGGEAERSAVEQNLRAITAPTIRAMRDMPKPLIAAVNGPAAGVGCSMALAADLVLAADSAFFLLAFANIGLTPDGGASLTVAARVGLGRAFVLALLAERLSAAEAVSWGLADRLVADAELAGVADALVRRLADGPTKSYAATKQAINRSMLSGLADALETETRLQAELILSDDFIEGSAAFAAKRLPRFTGR
jgi:2-(1,2-epoxy-1,2-dihydrophenyl)acetyl-CoA isomerase